MGEFLVSSNFEKKFKKYTENFSKIISFEDNFDFTHDIWRSG